MVNSRSPCGSLARVSERIGRVFPAGGPVPPQYVIGRAGEIAEVHQRLHERISTLVTGERRIGKTTVCDAACARAEHDGLLILKLEVPERKDGSSLDLLQQIVGACDQLSRASARRKVFRAAKPVLEEILEQHGIPLDLRDLGSEPEVATLRQVISLPLELARALDQQTVLYLDELQRAKDYHDGERFVGDLVDVYSNHADNGHVTALVDGSDARAFELLDREVGLGKLCKRWALGATIPERTWREELPGHFAEAGLEVDQEALEMIVGFGSGRPFPTMLAALYSSLNARKLGSQSVESFAAAEGIAEAERQMRDEGG